MEENLEDERGILEVEGEKIDIEIYMKSSSLLTSTVKVRDVRLFATPPNAIDVWEDLLLKDSHPVTVKTIRIIMLPPKVSLAGARERGSEEPCLETHCNKLAAYRSY